jgi:hypothetical protein
MLCWAAVTEMVANYHNLSASQCSQVRAQAPDCACVSCPESKTVPYGPCNHGGWPDFDRFGIHSKRLVNEALSLEALQFEISCERRPVAFTWVTGENSGHIMVAYGYQDDWIDIANPWEMCEGMTSTIHYSEYVNGETPGTSRHWDDFYELRRKATP